MGIKVSATFYGKCDICKKYGLVFRTGDEHTKKVVTMCKSCVIEMDGTPTSEVIKKFGRVNKKAFETGVKIK